MIISNVAPVHGAQKVPSMNLHAAFEMLLKIAEVLSHLFADMRETSSSNVCVDRNRTDRHTHIVLELGVACRGMILVILETVEVLIAFAACFAFVRLLFLHSHRSRIWRKSCRVDDRVSSILILVKLLGVVAML